MFSKQSSVQLEIVEADGAVAIGAARVGTRGCERRPIGRLVAYFGLKNDTGVISWLSCDCR